MRDSDSDSDAASDLADFEDFRGPDLSLDLESNLDDESAANLESGKGESPRVAAELANAFSSPKYLGYGPGMSPEIEEHVDKLTEKRRGSSAVPRIATSQRSPTGSLGVQSPASPVLAALSPPRGRIEKQPMEPESDLEAGYIDGSRSKSPGGSGLPPHSNAASAAASFILSPTNTVDTFDTIPMSTYSTAQNANGYGNMGSSSDFMDILLGPPRFGLKILYWFLGINTHNADIGANGTDRDFGSSTGSLASATPSDPFPEWWIKPLSILSYRRLLRLWSGYPPSFGERLTWYLLALILSLGLLAISILRVVASSTEWPMLAVSSLVVLYTPRFIMRMPLGPRLGVVVLLAAGETVIALEFAVNQSHAGFIEFLRESKMMQVVVGCVGGVCALFMIVFIGHFVYWWARLGLMLMLSLNLLMLEPPSLRRYFWYPTLLFANFDPDSILAKTVGRWPVVDWRVASFDPAELTSKLATDPSLSETTLLRRRNKLQRSWTSDSVLPVPNPNQAGSGWFRYRVVEPRDIFRFSYRKSTFRYIWDSRFPGRQTNGRPHGWGRWESSEMGGESIEGFWVDGEPTAPFLAVEARTGCASRAIRVGMARCYVADFDTGYVVPGADLFRDGLRWILTSVECSVSGTFFEHLPRAVIMTRDADPAGVVAVPYPASCAEVVARLRVSLIPTSEEEHRIFEESVKAHQVNGDTVPRGVPPANGGANGNREAIIFVHGYNTPPKWAVQMLGQVLTLGEFPSHIRPFVFAWPGGSSLMSFWNARRNAAKDVVRQALIEMIQQLQAQGFTSFHLLAHSMGSRVLASLAKPDNPDAPFDSPCALTRLFRPATRSHRHFKETPSGSYFGTLASRYGGASRTASRQATSASSPGSDASPIAADSSSPLAELASFTLIAAEIDLQSWQSYFINVYRYCRLVTIYSDEYDVALRIAKSFDAKARLGAAAANVGYFNFMDTIRRGAAAVSEVPGQMIRAGTNMVLGRSSAEVSERGKRSTDGVAGGSARASTGSVPIEARKPPLVPSATGSFASPSPRAAVAAVTLVPDTFGGDDETRNAAMVGHEQGNRSDSRFLSTFSIPSTLASLDRGGREGTSMPSIAAETPLASDLNLSSTETKSGPSDASGNIERLAESANDFGVSRPNSLQARVKTASSVGRGIGRAASLDALNSPYKANRAATSFSSLTDPSDKPPLQRVPTVRFSVELAREGIPVTEAQTLPLNTQDRARPSSAPPTSRSTLAQRYPNLPGIQYFDSVSSYYRFILAHGMDVVDCSNLDQNVNLLRHSTFTLNRSMIDDIRDIVVLRKRARERDQRLVRLDRNRWQFRVAPLWRSASS